MTTIATYSPLFFGPFRVITQKKQLSYEIQDKNPTIMKLITFIIKDYPKLQEYFFTKDGQLESNTAIIINGEDIRGGNGLDTIIFPNDRISFFKAAGGG